MLEVSDTNREFSSSYIYRGLEGEDFECTFTFLPSVQRRACFFRVRGAIDLFSLHVDSEGAVYLRSSSLPLYPGIYPGYLTYPHTTSFYPTSGLNTYPSPSHLETQIVPRSRGALLMSVYFSRNELEGRVEVYVDPVDETPEGSAFHGSLRWANSPISYMDLGCISARYSAYDLKFSNLKVNGELSEGNWYSLEGFDGFRSVPDGQTVKWQGARDPYDESTYSSYTDLRNLPRFDFARPEIDVTEAHGITWSL